MSTPLSRADYGSLAKLLHWAVAVLIISALCLGLYMTGLSLSPRKLRLFSYHKWIGITVLGLLILRAAWRVWHGAPPALPAPRWQQRAASLTHALLYLLMAVVPLTGWAMSSALGFPVVYLGRFALPDLVGKDRGLGETLVTVHTGLNYLLIALLLLHVAAALKHHFVDRDATLVRMLPRRRPLDLAPRTSKP